jgi:CubicO group peptidase (beta-lactamase class C family)
MPLPGLIATYLGRYLWLNRPTSDDQDRMPQRPLRASPRPQQLPLAMAPLALGAVRVTVKPGRPPSTLLDLLVATGTTDLVIVHRGEIVWEYRSEAEARMQPRRCFSVTKSVASALLGLALGAGCIDSIASPIGRWLPELRDPGVAALTLDQLLHMHSGIGFREGLLPWRDEPRTYYATDLRQRLARLRIADRVGAFFHYNDWHPLLLALVIERAAGQTVTAWLQQRLWDPLGAECGGSLMVDRDDAGGIEHLESGLTAAAIDLAKFGQLYLQDGVWQGRRLLPEGWVRGTTSPAGARTDPEWFAYYRDRPWGRVFAGGRTYYQAMWWGTRIDEARHDFFAMGVLGQHVYLAPDREVVIVRLSDRFPPGVWWAPVLRQLADAVDRCRPIGSPPEELADP